MTPPPASSAAFKHAAFDPAESPAAPVHTEETAKILSIRPPRDLEEIKQGIPLKDIDAANRIGKDGLQGKAREQFFFQVAKQREVIAEREAVEAAKHPNETQHQSITIPTKLHIEQASKQENSGSIFCSYSNVFSIV